MYSFIIQIKSSNKLFFANSSFQKLCFFLSFSTQSTNGTPSCSNILHNCSAELEKTLSHWGKYHRLRTVLEWYFYAAWVPQGNSRHWNLYAWRPLSWHNVLHMGGCKIKKRRRRCNSTYSSQNRTVWYVLKIFFIIYSSAYRVS